MHTSSSAKLSHTCQKTDIFSSELFTTQIFNRILSIKAKHIVSKCDIFITSNIPSPQRPSHKYNSIKQVYNYIVLNMFFKLWLMERATIYLFSGQKQMRNRQFLHHTSLFTVSFFFKIVTAAMFEDVTVLIIPHQYFLNKFIQKIRNFFND